MALDYAVAGSGTTLNASAGDAGRLLRFIDLYTRVAGGTLTLSGQGGPNGPMVGPMDVANFDVLNEPAMAKVGVGRKPPGGSADGFDPTRVHFDRMVARFNKTDAGGRDRGCAAARRRHRRDLQRPLRPAERDDLDHRHLSAGLRLQQPVQPHSGASA